MRSFVGIILCSLLLSACATNGDNSGQLIPEQSRATPELALLNQRAQLADVGGEVAQAEALYKSVLRKVPNDTETWYRLGNLYANNNRPVEAAIAYERTLISDNSYTKAWHNLAIIRLRQSYAALLQAQSSVNEEDPLAAKIDEMLEQFSKLSVLESQPLPVNGKNGIKKESVPKPITAPNNPKATPPIEISPISPDQP